MAFCTTALMAGDTAGLMMFTARGGTFMCCMAMATGVSPSKGTVPVSISYSTTPAE